MKNFRQETEIQQKMTIFTRQSQFLKLQGPYVNNAYIAVIYWDIVRLRKTKQVQRSNKINVTQLYGKN